MSRIPSGFIPAKESRFFIWFFRKYVKWLFKKRFSAVWVNFEHLPRPEESTLFISNHHYWWDGISPLLLNEYVFRQKARALMEDKQMQKWGFFSKIGAFSIDRSNLRSALFSLDYASEWLNLPGTSLFLYPEGKITPTNTPVEIESGILRILEKAPGINVVPLCFEIVHLRGDKPEMFICTGNPIETPSEGSKQQKIAAINDVLNSTLNKLRSDSHNENHGYTRLL